MLISQSPSRTLEQAALIEPRLAALLDRLDLSSRRVFAGRMPGERRAKARGQSVEFDDFRPYVPGDDLRHIDWNVFARLDRFVVKLFREDKDVAVHVLLDASPSMLAGGDAETPSKLLAASRLAAAIAYVGLARNDRVSVATFGEPAGPRRLAPVRGRSGMERVAAFIRASFEDADPTGARAADPDAALLDAARHAARLRGQRGVMVVVSDFLAPSAIEPAFARLPSLAHGFDTWCLQVLSADEMDPSRAQPRGFAGDIAAYDIERGRTVELTISPAMLRAYQERLAAHLARVEAACRAHGLHYGLVRAETPTADVLLGALRRQGLLA